MWSTSVKYHLNTHQTRLNDHICRGHRGQLLGYRCSLFLAILLHTGTLRNHRSHRFWPPAPVTCSWIWGTLGCDLDISHLSWNHRVQYVTLLRLLKQAQFAHCYELDKIIIPITDSVSMFNSQSLSYTCTSFVFCPRLFEEYRIINSISSSKYFGAVDFHDTCNCPGSPLWSTDTLKGGSR